MGRGQLGRARLIRPDGSAEWLTRSTNFTVLLGRWEKDLTLKSGLYQKMRLNGRTFDRGLNVQADSIIQVPLGGEFARLEASIGVDDWAGTNGSVRFSVLGARRAAVKRLWAPLRRDFATGPDRQQMKWEIEDRILEFDWRPGTGPLWRAATRKPANACRRWPAKPPNSLPPVNDRQGLERLRATCYLRSRALGEALVCARGFDFDALRSAVEDLNTSFPGKCPQEHPDPFRPPAEGCGCGGRGVPTGQVGSVDGAGERRDCGRGVSARGAARESAAGLRPVARAQTRSPRGRGARVGKASATANTSASHARVPGTTGRCPMSTNGPTK